MRHAAIVLSMCAAVASICGCLRVVDIEIPDDVRTIVVIFDFDGRRSIEQIIDADDLRIGPISQWHDRIVLGFDGEFAAGQPVGESWPFLLRSGQTCASPVRNLIWARRIASDATLAEVELDRAPALCWIPRVVEQEDGGVGPGFPDAAEASPCSPSSLISGGGLTGGDLAGKLDVFVVGEDGATRISGAHVLVVSNGLRFESVTSDLGCVSFAEPMLRGVVDAHVFASGFESASLFDASAASMTIALRPIATAAHGAATAKGSVEHLDAYTSSISTQASVAIAEPIRIDLFAAPLPQAEWPSSALRTDTASLHFSPHADHSSYELIVDPKTVNGVSMRGGPVDGFERFAIRSDVEFLAGETRSLDLDLHPLEFPGDFVALISDEQTAHPISVEVFARLAHGGFVHLARSNPTFVFHRVPSLTGALDGAEYAVLFHSGLGDPWSESEGSVRIARTRTRSISVTGLRAQPIAWVAGKRQIGLFVPNPTGDELVRLELSAGDARWSVMIFNSWRELAEFPQPFDTTADVFNGRALNIRVERSTFSVQMSTRLEFRALADSEVVERAWQTVQF